MARPKYHTKADKAIIIELSFEDSEHEILLSKLSERTNSIINHLYEQNQLAFDFLSKDECRILIEKHSHSIIRDFNLRVDHYKIIGNQVLKRVIEKDTEPLASDSNIFLNNSCFQILKYGFKCSIIHPEVKGKRLKAKYKLPDGLELKNLYGVYFAGFEIFEVFGTWYVNCHEPKSKEHRIKGVFGL